MIRPPAPEAVDRFRRDLALLSEPLTRGRIAVAVSGGPDSLALLLLAQAALPDRVSAATVDHGLRSESAAEARFVAAIAEELGVPHATLPAEWPAGGPPVTAIQESAREARYAALLGWCGRQGIDALLTAHHADDQAETLLMRLGRGAGLTGLAGIRPRQERADIQLLRPLLHWRRTELGALCRSAGLNPIEDPSNADPRHERTRIRRLLRETGGIDAAKVALSAGHLFMAEEAMRWIAAEVIRSRVEIQADRTSFDAEGLPREIKRRVLAMLVGDSEIEARGSAIDRALEKLENGRVTTLAGFQIRPESRWIVLRAPPRRAN